MPAAPDPITSPPPVEGNGYDATSESAVGKWQDLEGGVCDENFRVTGDFPSTDGWKQT